MVGHDQGTWPGVARRVYLHDREGPKGFICFKLEGGAKWGHFTMVNSSESSRVWEAPGTFSQSSGL